jgi:hypothetical protein
MSEPLQNIYNKLHELIKKYQLVQKDLHKVQQENIQLKSELAIQKKLISEATNTSNKTPVNTSNLSEDEKKKLEKRINGYLSDIEKCLALLNT